MSHEIHGSVAAFVNNTNSPICVLTILRSRSIVCRGQGSLHYGLPAVILTDVDVLPLTVALESDTAVAALDLSYNRLTGL